MYINGEFTLLLKQGTEKDMRSYYDKVYKDWRSVYVLLSPQEYMERFEWDF